MRPAILSFEGIDYKFGDAFSSEHPIHVHENTLIPTEIDLRGVRAIVVRNQTVVDAQFVSQFPKLEIIARAGVGLDNLDLEVLENRGVKVISGVGMNATSVAEHTLLLALSASRNLVVMDATTRSGGWTRKVGGELAGKAWGLLGAGATGRQTGQLAKAFGLRIYAYDPFVSDKRMMELGFIRATIDEVASRCNIISSHLPAVPETFQLLGQEFFGSMAPGTIFVNTGRGEVVDEAALIAALDEGRLLGAGLDVRAQEPPNLGRLERHNNVVLTPHIAGLTVESQARIEKALVDGIKNQISSANDPD